LTWHVDNTYPFPLTYDVYFGDFGNPNLVPVATNLVTPSYTRPGGYQAGRDYNWFVVAHGNGLTAYGPPWSFYTGPSQTNTPSNPSPPYLGTTSLMPTLSWSVVNPNGHPLTYEVHFGTLTGEFPLPTVATVSQPSYQPGPLEPGRRYYWRITACDESLCSIGPEWTFVAEGALPVLFASFNAAVLGDAIRVAWELTADENLREYALLRRQKGTTSWNTVVELPLDGLSGTFLDRGAARGKSYEYMMLIRTTGDDQFSSPIVGVDLPGLELMLGRNHPNPFNPQTVIPYDIPASSRVRVAIYDPSGRLVRVLVDEEQKAGMHEVSWNGRDDAGRTASSGVYFCVLESGKERRTQKLVLLK
jgi:hypothetical protein